MNMFDKDPIRILLICETSYDVLPMQRLVRDSAQPIKLSTLTLSADNDDYPLNNADVVLVDLGGLLNIGIDPTELGDTLYYHAPVILVGDACNGAFALEGIRNGAQDWLIHGHLSERPLAYVLEQARIGFSNQRNLIVSQARYQSVVEDQSEFICRFLPDYTLTFINNAYAACLGRPAHTLEGLSLLDITQKDDHKFFTSKINSLTPEFPVTSYDRNIVIDGDIYWQHWSDKAFFDSNGIMLEVQSVGTDITARRSAEQEALDNQARFQSLYQHAPIMMQELDERGQIMSVNELWMSTLGYNAESVTGHHAFRYVHDDSRLAAHGGVEKLREFGWFKDVYCQYVKHDGQSVDTLVSATAVFNADKTISRVLVVSKEILERPETELALLREKERMGLLLKSIGDAIIAADESEFIEYLNPCAERLTGWALEEARGQPIQQVFQIIDQTTRQPALRDVLACEEPRFSKESSYRGVLVDRSGSNHLIRSSVIPSRLSDGSKTGTILVFNEVETTAV